MSALSEILTRTEHERKKELEAIIDAGKTAFVEVGLAIIEYHAKRLYRNEFSSWEECCQKKWGWSRQRAAQLESSTVALQGLPKELSNKFDTERAAAAVAKVPVADREKVVRAAVATGRVTAKTIHREAEAVQHRMNGNGHASGDNGKVIRDAHDHPVPKAILDSWLEAELKGQEAQAHTRDLKRLVGNLELPPEKRPPYARGLHTNVIAEIEILSRELAKMIPYERCPACDGERPDACPDCLGRGWFSESQSKAVSA